MSPNTASRRTAIALCVTLLALVIVAMARAAALAGSALRGLEPHFGDGHRRVIGKGQIRFDGAGPERWALRFRRERRVVNTLRARLDKRRRTLATAAVTVGPVEAIRVVFGPYADQALKVAYCESKLSTAAVNGQYLGLFQMGVGERSRYGHGPTALEQARAAYVYFVASGRDWSPWSCQP